MDAITNTTRRVKLSVIAIAASLSCFSTQPTAAQPDSRTSDAFTTVNGNTDWMSDTSPISLIDALYHHYCYAHVSWYPHMPFPQPNRDGVCSEFQTVKQDPGTDRVVRRMLDGANDHPLIEGNLIELMSYRIANWDPDDPSEDLFVGDCTDVDPVLEYYENEGNVIYTRIDLVFKGKVNPAGPVAPGNFNPKAYGSNPLYGFVEINVDSDETSGGHQGDQWYGFLGTTPRFGHRADGLTAFSVRTARHWDDFLKGFGTTPQTQYTGVDFVFELGAVPTQILKYERGDSDTTFENGEAWVVRGQYLKRSSGYSFVHFWDGLPFGAAEYKPAGNHYAVRFSHNPCPSRTTVSLIFPMVNPNGEDNDFSTDNDVSIWEALNALNEAAWGSLPTGNPEDDMLADWFDEKMADEYLQSRGYNLKVTTATSYETVPPQDFPYVFTDRAPNQPVCDFDGDDIIDPDDEVLFFAHFTDNDGDPLWDADGQVNGIIEIPNFSQNFQIFDVNYDGFVDYDDQMICGY